MTAKRHGVEMQPGLGFRIRKSKNLPDDRLVQRLAAFQTPDIADQTNQFYVVSNEIRGVIPGRSVAGSACTVHVALGDNLMVHKALDVAQEGQVIVVNTGGVGNWAVVGELVALKANHRRIAGFVIDGFARDIAGIQEVGLPVFARGTSATGPMKRGPGEINYPICCGGVVVNPGDVVVADEQGIVVIPRDSANTLADRLESKSEEVDAYRRSVRSRNYCTKWVDDILEGGPQAADHTDAEEFLETQ